MRKELRLSWRLWTSTSAKIYTERNERSKSNKGKSNEHEKLLVCKVFVGEFRANMKQTERD